VTCTETRSGSPHEARLNRSDSLGNKARLLVDKRLRRDGCFSVPQVFCVAHFDVIHEGGHDGRDEER
jgi:hypothetical protein